MNSLYMPESQHKPSQMQASSQELQTHYFLDVGLFGRDDAKIFSQYKNFIQNTIIELGEDFRIESLLLSEEINSILMNQFQGADGTLDDSSENRNIFNDFLLCFVKDKISREKEVISESETKIQDGFSDKIMHHFDRNQKITNSLTFNTLSLGFCITAVDIWKKAFGKLPDRPKKDVILIPFATSYKYPQKQSMNKNSSKRSNPTLHNQNSQNAQIISCQLSSQNSLHPQPLTLHNRTKWRVPTPQHFQNNQFHKNMIHSLKRKQKSSKKTVLGEFLCSISKFSEGEFQNYVVVGLQNQFYRTAFIAWLIFNIKAFFSLTFNQYLDYFKDVYPAWESKYEKALESFFKVIQLEWSLLLKDYSVALNDDLEVLHKLVERIRVKTIENWQQKGESVAQYASSLAQ